jgi:hypothetical protein
MDRPPSPRARNLAVLLPLLGVFLFMPPFVTLFAANAAPWGVPLVVAYLFGAWAALLVACALLGRVLMPPEPGAAPDPGAPPESRPPA